MKIKKKINGLLKRGSHSTQEIINYLNQYHRVSIQRIYDALDEMADHEGTIERCSSDKVGIYWRLKK